MIARRMILAGGTSMLLLGACGFGAKEAKARSFPLTLTRAEWKKRLTPAQYRVLREADTERPFTSPLNNEKRNGIFLCAGCANPLFASATKYDSGTGWPSFWRPLKGAIATDTDYLLGYARTEVLCARCGGHLGHVFDDGPKPTGLRYCMNGVAMTFRAGPIKAG